MAARCHPEMQAPQDVGGTPVMSAENTLHFIILRLCPLCVPHVCGRDREQVRWLLLQLRLPMGR